MKYLLTILLIGLLSGCARTSIKVDEDGSIEWDSWTLAKDVKDAHVEWGTFTATLGSSVGNEKVIESSMRALNAKNLLNQCESDFTSYIEDTKANQ